MLFDLLLERRALAFALVTAELTDRTRAGIAPESIAGLVDAVLDYPNDGLTVAAGGSVELLQNPLFTVNALPTSVVDH